MSRMESSLPSGFGARNSKPEHIGPGREHLLQELKKLYWEGVKWELENIIHSLRLWQRNEFLDVKIDKEDDFSEVTADNHGHGFINGFDTFIDQVSDGARAFAIRYGNQPKYEYPSTREQGMYQNALRDVLEDRRAERASTKIRQDIRDAIRSNSPRLEGIEQLAWMLLQANGFLDIDKCIEYRKMGDHPFWNRPAIPQLTSSYDDRRNALTFKPHHCAKCKATIVGSMFISNDGTTICETCYRTNHMGQSSYTKAHKRCILAETMTEEYSRKLCHCQISLPHESTDTPLDLFPIDKAMEAKHVGVRGKLDVAIPCRLLSLGKMVVKAKYNGLCEAAGVGTGLPRWNLKFRDMIDHAAGERHTSSKATYVATEASADRDIPIFYRKFTDKYPFGNIHMALRIGPLMIENGVQHTHKGALITLRELPVFQERNRPPSLRDRSIIVSESSGSSDRTVWRQKRIPAGLKRYKAMMKQIVGLPFTGVPGDDELDIVRAVVAASAKEWDDPGLPPAEQRDRVDEALGHVLPKLTRLLEERVDCYLGSIVRRLLDPTTTLEWSLTGNNCQKFCDSLLDLSLFEPLVNGPISWSKSATAPLYVMSFVCPYEGYLRRRVKTKFDVPSGLTEEYLLRFHFGRHDEADILDTYQEYWYDWGAFGGPLYRYQYLFPWDCSEAFGRYPTKCGECNLAKHVWAFPFDSWSMIALHLTREDYMYAESAILSENGRFAAAPRAGTRAQAAQAGTGATTPTKSQSWMRNRLSVLTASAILTRAATAMAQTPSFCRATSWLHKDKTGLRVTDPWLSRVKLGGIHRAQPFSHPFGAGTYHHYFLAPWALRPRRQQIDEYERLRDERMRQPDVPNRKSNGFRDSGSGPALYGGVADAGFPPPDGNAAQSGVAPPLTTTTNCQSGSNTNHTSSCANASTCGGGGAG